MRLGQRRRGERVGRVGVAAPEAGAADGYELAADGSIVSNKFDNTPALAGWGRRPFELATLRLQNLIGVQGKNWEALKPVDDRCLTQLGGCVVVDGKSGGDALYSWVDRGLCDVADFDEMVEML